jgi:catechol 2,3-dioxygenase-like lactoylglutathione lyase family enzyme
MEVFMEIQALGYLGVGTAKLDDWTSLATRGLGMEAIDRGAGTRAFRMDDRKQRLVLDSTLPDGAQYFGWEVEDAEKLAALAARLERAGVAVQRESAALADQRFVAGLISFRDPAGNRLEAFYGAAVADEPFHPSRLISGFRAGPLGMGHVLVTVQDMTASLAFPDQRLYACAAEGLFPARQSAAPQHRPCRGAGKCPEPPDGRTLFA